MAFDRTLELKADEQVVFFMRVAFLEREYEPDEFLIQVRRERDDVDPVGVVAWQVRSDDYGYSLTMTTHVVGAAVCLAGCFAGIVLGPMSDCLKKARSRTAVRECINQHGFWSAVTNLSCIYGCLSL